MNDHLHQINSEFTDVVSDITRNTLKVGAVLRLIQHLFDHGQDHNISQDDMGALIDLCLDTLPRDYQDIYDPLEKLSNQYYRAIKNSDESLDKIQAELQARHVAMTAIANPNTTVDELTEAGMAFYRIVQKNPEYEADWNTWLECVEARGYAVGWIWAAYDDRTLHLTATGLSGLKTAPTPDSAGHTISERLSAEDIAQVSDILGSTLRIFLQSRLSLQPEPLAKEPESQH